MAAFLSAPRRVRCLRNVLEASPCLGVAPRAAPRVVSPRLASGSAGRCRCAAPTVNHRIDGLSRALGRTAFPAGHIQPLRPSFIRSNRPLSTSTSPNEDTNAASMASAEEQRLLGAPFRQFLLKVHPDVQADDAHRQVNSASLAALNGLLAYVKTLDSEQHEAHMQQTLVFHVRPDQKDAASTKCTTRVFLPEVKGDGRNVQRYAYRRVLYLLCRSGATTEEDWAELRRLWRVEDKAEDQGPAEAGADGERRASENSGSGDTAREAAQQSRSGQERLRGVRFNSGDPTLQWIREHPLAYVPHAVQRMQKEADESIRRYLPERYVVEELMKSGRIRFHPDLVEPQRLDALGRLRNTAVEHYEKYHGDLWNMACVFHFTPDVWNVTVNRLDVPWNFSEPAFLKYIDVYVDLMKQRADWNDLEARRKRLKTEFWKRHGDLLKHPKDGRMMRPSDDYANIGGIGNV